MFNSYNNPTKNNINATFTFGKLGKHIVASICIMLLFISFNCGEPTDQNEIQNITSIYLNDTNTSLKIINYKNNKKFKELFCHLRS